ncbi:TPA: PKD domain-containing protein [Thermoplasmata archaeon]|nr:PKD domain-containing protein [Thermoplasmata archaeon]
MVASGIAATFLNPDVGDSPLRGHISAVTIDSFTVNGGTSATVYIGEEVTFEASAHADSGTQLIFTIFYDAILDLEQTPNPNSPFSVNVTGNPGDIFTTYTYDRLGNLTSFGISYYRVKLSVFDGTNTLNLTRTVYVKENSAPLFELDLEDGYVLDPDEQLNMSIRVLDPDGDSVTVTWDFGDGEVVTNETGPAATGVSVSQTHAWSPDIGPGMGPSLYYYLLVTLEDPYSNTNSKTTVITITLPANGLPVVTFTASTNTIDPEVEMTFYASATDPEGEALTWTFVFNNTIEDVDTVVSHTDATAPGTTVWNNLTYAFETSGTYKVRLWVSDALIPYQILPHNVTREVSMTVRGNSAPSLTSVISMAPEAPSINTAIGYVNVIFTINAWDADGDVVTLEWDMDDGEDPRINTTSGGLVVYDFKQVRTFTETGIFNITVTATDGIEGHETARYRLATVTSNNLPPSVTSLNFSYESGNFALPNESIEFVMTLSDPELDTLEVVWDFGDNTSLEHFNLTDYVDGTATCVVNHSYSSTGRYNVTIWFTDNQLGLLNHTKVYNAVVSVNVPNIKVVTGWSWWDYTSLVLLGMIPVAFFLNLLRIRKIRRNVEKQGMTIEEMKLLQSETVDEPDDYLDEEVD